MSKKINGHTESFLKRQAKTIKKTQQVSHSKALDLAAIGAGFSNWKHFISSKLQADTRKNTWSVQLSTDALLTNAVATDNASMKMNPYRKLLIAGINELLNRRLIALNVKDDDVDSENEKGYVLVNLFEQPSVIIWRNIEFEELLISVWWKYNHDLHPQANLTGNAKENFNGSSPLAKRNLYKNFVGVTASGWLERRTSKHLQGKGNNCILDVYTRNGERSEIENLPCPQPNGFRAEGKFFI